MSQTDRSLYDEWKRLTLSQFYGKKILMGIARAAAEILEQVYEEQQELRTLLDIDAQEGVNLDHLGEIVSINRTEAHEFIVTNEEFEMTDELYRKMLRYKILLNNSNATYYDIMEGVNIIWDTDNVIYRETPERPATIFLDLKTVNVDGIDPGIGRILAIKPAGVGLLYYVNYLVDVDISSLERANVPSIAVTAEFPFWRSDHWILNGFWRLDGKRDLDGINRPLPMWMLLTAYPIKNRESFSISFDPTIRVGSVSERSHVSVVMTSEFYYWGWVLDGFWKLNGRRFLTSAEPELPVGIEFGVLKAEHRERLTVGAILRKNLWYLDGTYDLDGTKEVNANITEEVL